LGVSDEVARANVCCVAKDSRTRCELVVVAALGLMRTAAFEQNHAQRIIAIVDQLRRADRLKGNVGTVQDVDKAGALQRELGTKSGLILRSEIQPDIAAADFLAVYWKAVTLRQRIRVEMKSARHIIVHCAMSPLQVPAFGSKQNTRTVPGSNSL
jgi:hypothetical protein